MIKLILASLAFVFLVSCTDLCKNVSCADGVCIEGFCECNLGAFGESCTKRYFDKYYGSWKGQLECETTCQNKIEDESIIKIIRTADPLRSRMAILDDTLSIKMASDMDSNIILQDLLLLDSIFIDTLSFDNINIIDSVKVSGRIQFVSEQNIDFEVSFTNDDNTDVFSGRLSKQ